MDEAVPMGGHLQATVVKGFFSSCFVLFGIFIKDTAVGHMIDTMCKNRIGLQLTVVKFKLCAEEKKPACAMPRNKYV